ncbi:hypothetical protein DFQ28_009230 [Apophysomyces sp. BC1034]|nr:hypothetical protein DFQ30_003313 [Apophysomyces sp. BC1015]KAG0173114.1 hypothetical protein DFQ29_008095 [Apophysomyces sp. BC1021]KAG0185494.1 hypothetical protein DFQ28_009230 [Apophysomyces sp. BC1034]
MAISPQPNIDFNFYEQPSTISHFDAILENLRNDLVAEGTDATFTAPELAHFTARFQQFQQNVLGYAASQTARLNNQEIPPRIPASLFQVDELSPSSSLYVILLAAYSFQSDRDISDWQFDFPEERDIYIELVRYVFLRLVEAGLYHPPCVAFREDMTLEEKDELVPMIKMLGGQITEDIAQATHIIYSDKLYKDNQRGHAMSIIKRKNRKALVHYQGLPSSYDTWMDESECKGYPERNDGGLQQSPWHVKAGWVKDSYLYNEWEDPADYDYFGEQTRKTKKRSVEDSLLEEVSPSKKSKMPTPENQHIGEVNPTGYQPNSLDLNNDPVEEQRREEATRKFLPMQRHDIVIPSYCAWFDITKINDIERRSVPEFFNNRNKSKTPTVYKDYRDFMVNTYRTNPPEYLTITACRRNLIGDVCSIIRVHTFLEQWGLINYQVDPQAKLSGVPPPFESQFKVVLDTSREVNTPAEIVDSEGDDNNAPTARVDVQTSLQDNAVESSPDDSNNEASSQRCAICNDTCNTVQYRSSRLSHLHICSQCYFAAKFPEDHTSSDFVICGDNTWTEEEDALLLQGLEMFEDDWNKIVDHIGSRTHEECILHYLALPTNDPNVDKEISKLGLLQSKSSKNPIMSAVAFLASTVRPKVAAAAASIKVKETVQKDEEKDEEESTFQDLAYQFIRAKLRQFEMRLEQYNRVETIVDEERQELQREQYQLSLDRLAFKKKVAQIQNEVAKRGGMATAIANSITPAQIQQQMAGGAMFMDLQQQQALQQQIQMQQQQQYQLQLQMQMQAQQQGQVQPNIQGHNYNMLPL